MKTLNAIAQQIKGWRQKSQQNHSLSTARESHSLTRSPQNVRTSRQSPAPKPPSPDHPPSKIPAPVMLVFVVVSLTSTIGYRFYNQPQLKQGTIAPKTIVANKDARVEDPQTTETQRKEAETGTVAVLKIDPTLNNQIEKQFQDAIAEVAALKNTTGSFPFVDESILPLATQSFLRNASDSQWQATISALDPQNPSLFDLESPSTLQDPEVEKAAADLKLYLQQSDPSQLNRLLTQIHRVRDNYQQALRNIQTPQINTLSLESQQQLLALSNDQWLFIQQVMQSVIAKMLAQGIPQGLPEEIRRQAIKIHLEQQIPEDQVPGVVELLMGILEPNLVEDREQTKLRAEQAIQQVDPVFYEVKAGQEIVRAGQEIGRREFVLIDRLGLSRRGINWGGIALSGSLVVGSVGIFWLVKRRLNLRLRCRDRILLCLLSVSTPLLVSLNVKHANLSAVGLLTSSYYSPTLAVTQVILLSGLTTFGAISAEGGLFLGWEYLIPSVVGGLIASFVAGRMRCREDLALLGGIVGISQGGVNLIVTLIASSTPGAIWSVALSGAAACGLWGVAWCVVALGISPYLEKLFDLITPIRLAELSNPNRPLLKRLATEAPGTFQHTLFVASLAEAAARELHCNVELVRAGTLYHDIGKMHDPLGFIENQMGGPNKHDEINNPWKSAEIIQKHVSEGLVMARKYNLPQAIRDFIPEHQGTILISYFYFQAQQKAQEEGKRAVDEADFRYDGPIPQSRETGIVMLADACEAALRSLRDVTPDVALATVKKIFTARWRDNQLVDSGLRKEELPIIAEVFVRVWQQYNHQRIAYPKAALEPQPSTQ